MRRLISALQFSWAGLRTAFMHEESFRLELYCGIVLVPLGLWLGENGIERALLIGSLMLIAIVELLNSAVEAAIDRIGSDHHELSRRAKDMGSAAVLMAVIAMIVIWVLVLTNNF